MTVSLKQKAIAGFIWTSAGGVGSGIINFLITIFLARLLGPYEFGILELLIIFTTISAVFVDSGFSQAIIRDVNPSQSDLSSVFYLQFFVALILYIILFFSAPLIAGYFEAQELIALSRFVFLVIVFDSISLVQNANLNRQLNFKPYALASITAILISGIVAIVLAFMGYGVWSLAINVVLISLLRSVILWYKVNWKPSLIFNIDSLKKYFKFSINLLLHGLIDKIVSNLESIIIGKIYSKQALGYFSQSRKFNAILSQPTTNIVQKVTFPSLSKIADNNDRLKDGYRRVIGVTMVVIAPLMFFTMVAANNIVLVFFGEKWIKSAEYLELWSIWGILFPISSISSNIFLVKGQSRLLLKLSIIRQLGRILVIVILAQIGIMEMLWGIIFVSFFGTVLNSYYGNKLIGYTFPELSRDLIITIGNSIISILFVFTSTQAFHFLSPYLLFFLQFVVMISTYMFLNKYLFKNLYFFEAQGIFMSLIFKRKT